MNSSQTKYTVLNGKYSLQQLKPMALPTAVFFVVFAVAISAILRADFNYIDDMGRVCYGYSDWSDTFSRYLSDGLSVIVHGDSYLTDVSPLPQLLALLIMAVTSTIVIYVVSGKRPVSVWSMIAVLPLTLSPYFLECLSYKYDAPYMALSVLLAVLPLLFTASSWWIYGAVTALCMIGVCTSYQVSLGIYPMLVVLLALRRWNGGESWKTVAKWCLLSAAFFLLGVIVFQTCIMRPVDTYVSNAVVGGEEFLPRVLHNYRTYFTKFTQDFKWEWKLFLAILMAAFFWVTVRDSKRNKFASFAVTLAAAGVMILLTVGGYPFLQAPIFDPRTMYGIGVLIALFGLQAALGRKVYWGKLMSVALAWAFFVFAFTYGNALSVQKDYADFRMTVAAQELQYLDCMQTEDTKELQIVGEIGYAAPLRHMPRDYTMLSRMVPVVFGSSQKTWNSYMLVNYYGLSHLHCDTGADFSELNLPLVSESAYQNIYADDTHILLELK